MINNEKKLKSLIRESVRLMMEQPNPPIDRSKGRWMNDDADFQDLVGIKSGKDGNLELKSGQDKEGSKQQGLWNRFFGGDKEDEAEEVAKQQRIAGGELKKKGMIASFFGGEEGYDESNGNYYVTADSDDFCEDLNFQKLVEMFKELGDVVSDGISEHGDLEAFTITYESIDRAQRIYKNERNVLVICLNHDLNQWMRIISAENLSKDYSRNYAWLAVPVLGIVTGSFGFWLTAISGSFGLYKMSQKNEFSSPFEFLIERFGRYNSNHGWGGWWNWFLGTVLNVKNHALKENSGNFITNIYEIQGFLKKKEMFKNAMVKMDELYEYKRETGEEWEEIVNGDNGEIEKQYTHKHPEDIKNEILNRVKQIKLMKNEVIYQDAHPDINKKIRTSSIDWNSKEGKAILKQMGNDEPSEKINLDKSNKLKVIKMQEDKLKKFRRDNESWSNWLNRKLFSKNYSDYNSDIDSAVLNIDPVNIDVEGELDSIDNDIRKK